jgi:pseudouridine 5'-phosphatase
VLPRPDALLFDLDGCLLDTEPVYTAATQAVLDEFGKTFEWSLKRRMMGRDLLVGARLLVAELGIPLTPEEYLRRCDPLLERGFAECEPLPGAREFVERVAERFPLAVATSSARPLFELKTRRHAWFSRFGAVVCGDDPRVKELKPSPDIFLTAAADLGVPPARCCVFEDAISGVRAARAAGMQVIALPDPHLDAADFAEASLVVRRWDELSAERLGW